MSAAGRRAAPRSRATAAAGRSIVGGPPGSRGGGGQSRPGSRAGGGDAELRSAALKLFKWCDSDGDGRLSSVEFAAAQRLVAQLREADVDERAVGDAFKAAGDGSGDRVGKDAYLETMLPMLAALELPRRELLLGLERLTVQSESAFGREAKDLAHSLVRNTSNLGGCSAQQPPPPASLWRTATGKHAFPLPPGVVDGPPTAKLAFQTIQFLAMRTEDASAIEPETAAQMMGHRPMFMQMLDMCGEVQAVHLGASADSGTVAIVDFFLMHSPDAEQVFRLRVGQMRVGPGIKPKCAGMASFEGAPVEPVDVPRALWVKVQDQGRSSGCALSGGGPPSEPPPLSRAQSLMGEADLQTMDLVLTSSAVARHVFRVRFRLAEGKMGPAPSYVMIVPRLASVPSGHARYADHCITVKRSGDGAPPQVIPFGSFVVANVRAAMLSDLVVEHHFTNCCVRVQARDAARRADIVDVPELSPEERALNLADDFAQSQHLRDLLGSKGLARRPNERDIVFAVRLGRALCDGYKYDAAATEANLDSLPTFIWEKQCGDCSAFNAGYVYALRAFGVPARVSLGFKYGHSVERACGSFVATHAQAEFFVESVGWIPCDATLGVRRLGHEASSQLSFVEWRPAAQSLAEAEEVAQVLQSSSDPGPMRQRLQEALEKQSGGQPMTVSQLASGLARAEGLAVDEAELRAAQILSLCGFGAEDSISAEDFVRGALAVDLGKFRELGTGVGLASTALAGLKMYEGGPFRSEPLGASRLKENMMVIEGIDRVMEHVGCSNGAVRQAADWGRMWPYGVFMCSYEFEEQPA